MNRSFGLGLHLNNSPWRLGPAWAVLAGALASQAPLWGGEGLLRLGGSLLLADALWGILWRMPLSRQGTHAGSQQRLALPYANAESPMVQSCLGSAGRIPRTQRPVGKVSLLVSVWWLCSAFCWAVRR